MIESFVKNKVGIGLMLISSMCACVGQLMWKLSDQRGMVYLLVGCALYVIGGMVMLVAYRFGSLSVLQPMLSIGYIFSGILGMVVLHEPLTTTKIFAILIITAGAVLIAGGDS